MLHVNSVKLRALKPSSQFSLNSSPSTTATPPAPLYIFGIAVLLLLCPYPINLLVRPRKMLMPCFVNENKAKSTRNHYICTSNLKTLLTSFLGWSHTLMQAILYTIPMAPLDLSSHLALMRGQLFPAIHLPSDPLALVWFPNPLSKSDGDPV